MIEKITQKVSNGNYSEKSRISDLEYVLNILINKNNELIEIINTQFYKTNKEQDGNYRERDFDAHED